jgi:hypothetical protein
MCGRLRVGYDRRRWITLAEVSLFGTTSSVADLQRCMHPTRLGSYVEGGACRAERTGGMARLPVARSRIDLAGAVSGV